MQSPRVPCTLRVFPLKLLMIQNNVGKYVVCLFFLCFAGLPPMVLLLYWAGLPSAILGLSVLSKGVETGPIGTQIGPACAQIMPCLPGACLRQTELF